MIGVRIRMLELGRRRRLECWLVRISPNPLESRSETGCESGKKPQEPFRMRPENHHYVLSPTYLLQ